MANRIDLANKAELDALRLELRDALNGYAVAPYRVSDGPPTDAPQDGQLPTIDTTNNRLYVRTNGAWRFAELGENGLGLTGEQLATLASVASKADQTDVDEALALKADQDDVATALATKVNSSTYSTGMASKADKTALDTEAQARETGDADTLAAVAAEAAARTDADALKADAAGTTAALGGKVAKGEQFVSVNEHGAKGDCVTVMTGSTEAGSPVLTVAPTNVSNTAITAGTSLLSASSYMFTDVVIGQRLTVPGAGANGAELIGTVIARRSSTQVELSVVAATTVSGVASSFGAFFTQDDVGKLVVIKGATSSTFTVGGNTHTDAGLRATIASRQSATQVTLSTNATATVAGTQVRFGTDNKNSILAAWGAARRAGKVLSFNSLAPYLTSALELPGDKTRIWGFGSKVYIDYMPSQGVNSSPTRAALYAYGKNLEFRNLDLEVAIIWEVNQAGFGNYEIARLGGQTGVTPHNGYGIEVVDCSFTGGAGCNVMNTENVVIDNCKSYKSHGNAIGAVNCKGDVRITNCYSEYANDDLLAVTSDTGTGQASMRVVVSNNIMREGDAGGIKIAGADHVTIDGNHVWNTYTAAISLLQETVYNLQRSERSVISDNIIRGAGKRYGGGAYRSSVSSNAQAIALRGYAADCIIADNLLLDTANRAISITEVAGVTIEGNRIIGAGSVGIEAGNIANADFDKIYDVTIQGNTIRNVQSGIIVGSGVGVSVQNNQIRSYKNAGNGSYWGIVYNYLKNSTITGNVIYNDDGGSSQQVREATPGSSVNTSVYGNVYVKDTSEANPYNVFTIGTTRIAFASDAPTAGTWGVGDTVYNIAPVNGAPQGWQCTAAGSPGTWLQFGQVGAISASVEGVVRQRSTVGSWITTTGTSVSTGVATAGRMTMVPVSLAIQRTITELNINVTATAAGSSVRLGIYADDGSTAPGALILDAGTVDTSSGGLKTISGLSQVLPAGTYWLAAVAQGGTPTLSVLSGRAPGLVAQQNPSTNVNAFYQDSVTGALPASASTAGIFGAGIAMTMKLA